jgi:predicted phosphodiesterase
MKIAVLADIHANLAALEAVAADVDAWRPDRVLVAGDVVNRGPQPADCVAFVRNRETTAGWGVLKGNHEDFVLSHLAEDGSQSGPGFEIRRHSLWTFNKLRDEAPWMAALPDELTVTLPAGPRLPQQTLRAVHASMLGNRRGIYPRQSDEELRRLIAPPPSVLVVGHTHRPLIRSVDGTLVINVGSVGLPFDGEWRPCYARLTLQDSGWRVSLVRVPYDRGLTDRLFSESGFLAGGGAMTRIVLAELRTARSLTYDWAVSYQDAVLQGELGLDASISRYLAEQGLDGI